MATSNADGVLLVALLAELAETVNRDQQRRLLMAVGERIAAALPLPEQAMGPEIEAWVNQAWAGLDLGRGALQINDSAVEVVHHLPQLVDDRQHLQSVLPAVIEGAYSHWLNAMSGARLDLARLPSEPDRLEFRYGG